MERIESIMRTMDFEFFGLGKHKTKPTDHFLKENAVFLDVRSEKEHDTIAFKLKYHMPVIHIPFEELPDRLNDVPKDKHIGVFCSSGVRASIAYIYLRAKGYENVRILEGGYSIVDEFKPGKLHKIVKNQANS
ncbi:MAG: rhodanese-like domain-containing protein [Candidatus Ranarchaeia archaeon]